MQQARTKPLFEFDSVKLTPVDADPNPAKVDLVGRFKSLGTATGRHVTVDSSMEYFIPDPHSSQSFMGPIRLALTLRRASLEEVFYRSQQHGILVQLDLDNALLCAIELCSMGKLFRRSTKVQRTVIFLTGTLYGNPCKLVINSWPSRIQIGIDQIQLDSDFNSDFHQEPHVGVIVASR